MGDVPLILVVGGDALAVRVCHELCSTQGHRVALVWPHDHELAKQIEGIGCDYLPFSLKDDDSLRAAGVPEATSLMALGQDDRVNLQVALKARDLNPNIRIVLRQFNRTLARKIEQNLPNCSVLSLASHTAATIVGAALDPNCFYALQFPDLDGVLCGFSERSAQAFGIAGLTWPAAQKLLKMRVVALAGDPNFDRSRRFASDDQVLVFGELRHLLARSPMPKAGLRRVRPARVRTWWQSALTQIRHADPVVRTLVGVAATVFVLATVLFSRVLHKDILTAAYFVSTTMTTTGYGDIVPTTDFGRLITIGLQIMGVAFSGIAIAFLTTALTRAQFTSLQGLRQIRTRGHTVVCGAGNVGMRVTEFLRMLNQRVVVIDPQPEPEVVEQSRVHEIELLTGDATRDGTLDLCHLQFARSLIAVTPTDTGNLEVALGARGRNPNLRVVMRVGDDAFAGSIERQFEAIQTFSSSSLAAPAFAGLSRFPGTRARIAFGGEDYNVGERLQGEVPMPPPADHCIALGVWRKAQFLHIDGFDEMEPFDRLLFIVPLSQFRVGTPRREQHGAPFAKAQPTT
jgi:Trk K+ transport system NAD-binding subunit